MSELQPTQLQVEQALLALRPVATWAPAFICGVAVQRLDLTGAWYRVGMYEGDVLRDGNNGELDLMDAAHALRLGLGRYVPRFEHVTCDVCAQTKPGGRVSNCPACVLMVCADCHNEHTDSHADHYAQLALTVDDMLVAMPGASRTPPRLERKPCQLEMDL